MVEAHLGDVWNDPMIEPRPVRFRSSSHRLCFVQRGVHLILALTGGAVLGGIVLLHLYVLFMLSPMKAL